MHSIVFITAKGRKGAEGIAEALLSKRLIACANIMPVSSRYWWKGRIERTSETLIIAKTKKSLAEKITKLVKSMHSYDVPEVIAVHVIAGNKDYMRWIDDETI